jgi:hypothetical protein
MNTSLNNLAQTFIPFRYFHVYVQKFFLELAPSPLDGSSWFYAFQMSLLACLAYLNARLLPKNNGLIHGSLAAISFLLLPLILESAGDPLIDFSAAVMVMVFVTIYNIYFRVAGKPRLICLFLLGAVFYLALNTKETTICLCILFLGVFIDNGRVSLSRGWQKILAITLGGVCGLLVLAFFNGIFLKDPLFSLRISTLLAQKDLNETVHRVSTVQNWYSNHIFVTYTPLFLLFILAGYKQRNDLPLETRLLWLVPLALVIVLTFTLLPRGWGLTPRYFFPAIPIICFLFPQFLNFDFLNEKKDLARFALAVAAFALASIGVVYALERTAAKLDWDFSNFLSGIWNPIVFSIMLMTILFIQRPTYFINAILIIGLLLLNAYSIRTTVKYLVFGSSGQSKDTFNWYFHPYISFRDQIDFSPNMTFLVPANLYSDYGLLGNNEDEVKDMYNIYFDTSAVRANFNYERDASNLADDLINNNYTYAFMHMSDWLNISGQPTVESAILAKYSLAYDPLNILVLFTHK